MMQWSDVKDEIAPTEMPMNSDLFSNNLSAINISQLGNRVKPNNGTTLQQCKKQNFRQRLRLLRADESDCGSLVASSQDQVDMEDDEGFILPYRHKRNRKSKLSVQKKEGDNAAQRIEIENKSSSSRRSVKLKTRVEIQSLENSNGKQAWKTTPNNSMKIFDFGKCPICYQPWQDDDEKFIAGQCGHCFHSECIRLWNKRKNTCPCCACFLLDSDQFPYLI